MEKGEPGSMCCDCYTHYDLKPENGQPMCSECLRWHNEKWNKIRPTGV